MKIAIIGAGIGGLASAIALQQQGHQVRVYEAAPEIKPVGAGLWLAPNGQEVLKRLQPKLLETVLATGFITREAVIMTHQGQVLTCLKTDQLAQYSPHAATLAIRRSALHQLLLKALAPETVVCGQRFVAFQQTAQGVEIQFENSPGQQAELLIGADGLHSRVRTQLFGELPLRYSGQTCWRGLSPFQLKGEWTERGAEIWGPTAGLRAGFSQVDTETVYFYVTALAQPGHRESNPTTEKALLQYKLQAFPAVVKELIAQTPAEQLMRHDLYDLRPLKRYHQGRVVLLGDAAHATTPNLGQGANQALESALSLATSLQSSSSLESALLRYEQRRVPKASQVINSSWQINQAVNLQSPWLRQLRNFALSHLPKSLSLKRFEQLYRLSV